MEKAPENLPEIEKQEIVEEEKFKEQEDKTPEKSRKVWIVVLAFAILATIGVVVWFVFSGRTDQKIHGDNLNALLDKNEADDAEILRTIDPGEIVNDAEIDLTNYETNITITEPGTHTLSGISNNSVLVKSEGEVTLNLNGVTISSVKTAAIANQTESPLKINLLADTTNTLSDGGTSLYNAAVYSNGELEILGDGKLIVSGRQTNGHGILVDSNDLKISSGKIMVTSEVYNGILVAGLRGSVFVEDGILWVKSEKTGIEAFNQIYLSGGNVLVMSLGDSETDAAFVSGSGIFIEGGNVIGLSRGTYSEISSHKESRNFVSAQLTGEIPTGANVILRNTDARFSRSFTAETEFKNLVFSVPDLPTGVLEISADGVSYGQGLVEDL